MIHEQFYKELGKFLYALALSDGSIHPKEIEKIETLISEELDSLTHLNEHPEYKEIILTKLSFFNCIREHLSVKDSSHSFKDFISKHRSQIDDYQKALAEKLIDRVAQSYKGKNKVEEGLEEEIKKILSTHTLQK